jgi:glutamyl-tRNA reductase
VSPVKQTYRWDVPHGPSFHLIGVSHHTAAVPVREQFAFSPAETTAIMDLLRDNGMPAVLLSTCNRCELYWSGDGDGEAWFHRLARGSTNAEGLILTRHKGMAAVRHLFRVSAGLDSQILGELEVLGQVRRAYDTARGAGTTTPELDLIFSAALAAGRRVRRETVLGRHPSSVSSAAVDLVLQQWGGSEGPEVILLGAGEAAEGILRAFHQRGTGRVTLLGRKPEKTATLAAAWSAEYGSLGELEQRLIQADVLLVATASAWPVVKAAQLAQASAARDARRELMVVDLAIPRNVEPRARAVPGVRLLDLDDLQRLCCPVSNAASAALAEAEGVIEDEVVRLGLTLRGRLATPQLTDLHRISRQMAEEESGWALSQLGRLSPDEREIVKRMADRLVRRVLYPVSRALRQSGVRSEESGIESESGVREGQGLPEPAASD